METITLDHDIRVLYINAETFPAGVLAAHEQLHARIPPTSERRYFGLSRPEGNGNIIYKAAVESLHENENQTFQLDSMIIKKGRYTSIDVEDFMKQPERIGIAFQQLLEHPKLDPQGYCVECYLNDNDVRCMIRLAE
jgi:hypothetical protein